MLEIKNLKVNYGESKVLFDVNMEIPDGEIVCLMGRNGVGKTTLLNTVMGLLKPREGELIFHGEAMTELPTYRRVRSGIGYVPQGRGIFSGLSVYENLQMGLEPLYGRSHVEMEDQASAIDEMLELFPALKPILSRKGGNLSGGQQQQLALARALMADPVLLLLDEPTEGIQPSIIDQIEEMLLRIKKEKGISMLLVEQYVDFAVAVGDRYYFMETGSIAADGLMSNLTEETIRTYMEV